MHKCSKRAEIWIRVVWTCICRSQTAVSKKTSMKLLKIHCWLSSRQFWRRNNSMKMNWWLNVPNISWKLNSIRIVSTCWKNYTKVKPTIHKLYILWHTVPSKWGSIPYVKTMFKSLKNIHKNKWLIRKLEKHWHNWNRNWIRKSRKGENKHRKDAVTRENGWTSRKNNSIKKMIEP